MPHMPGDERLQHATNGADDWRQHWAGAYAVQVVTVSEAALLAIHR
jgi:hypothetical protein